MAGFLEIASAVHLPERNEQDQSVTIAAVKGWLSQHTNWLLILDNADDLALLSEFLPSPLSGHLLLTTRTQALGGLAGRIEIETLDLDDAALLLLRRAGLLVYWLLGTSLQKIALQDGERSSSPTCKHMRVGVESDVVDSIPMLEQRHSHVLVKIFYGRYFHHSPAAEG